GVKQNMEKYLFTFDNLCKEFKKLNPVKSNLQWHFLDYMEKLGYYINTEKISKKDLYYVIQNKDKSLLKNKWNKYLTN
ncbi:MAG: hypothetical protein KAH04_01680, partial [Psychrilyobacter sp.]|nr:hypothetical protein [Psychrilyobacter sp.]